MIEEIHIRDLGVITDAVLPLGPGLTILSGETGAGKTMVVTGLTLLFGGRADPGRVRANGRAGVEGRLALPAEALAPAVPAEFVNGCAEEHLPAGQDLRTVAFVRSRR